MFRIKLKQLREERNLSQYEFAKAFGVAQSTVGGWESGARIPRLPMLEKIAAFFNVSTDCLIGKEDNAETCDDLQVSQEEFVLFGEIRDLTDEEKKRVLNFIRFTKSQRYAESSIYPHRAPNTAQQSAELPIGDLAAFSGDIQSNPKRKDPEIT